jgi:AcrR family transcriptional regulator
MVMRTIKTSKVRQESSRTRATGVPQDGIKSKEAILRAALKVFACDGYDGASMPKIAKLAQVAQPLIHYYFGSKEKLWRDTVDRSLGELRREASVIRQATQALAPLDRLRALLQTITQFAARWPDHFVMIVAEARSDSGRFAWINENYTGVLFDEIVAILQDARDSGAIQNVDVTQLVPMLIGGILLHFTVRPNLLTEDELDKMSVEFTDLMFKMFLYGVAVR